MTRHRRRLRPAEGTAWLVADRALGGFVCYWYTGRASDHLAEHTRATSAEEAVAWGQARSTRVRIRTADGCSQWAGTAPRPDGLSHTWAARAATTDGGADR